MKPTAIIAVMLVIPLLGCGTPTAVATRQAAFDHNCPEDNIRILRKSDDGFSLEMDVCGRTRRYQDMSRKFLTWVDVTDCGSPRRVGSPPQ